MTDYPDEYPPHEEGVWRCRRGYSCAERVRVDVEKDDGETTYSYWVGALLNDDGLCRSCTSAVASEIAQIPGDCEELSELLPPTGERWNRDPDMPSAPPGKPGSDTPWRDDVYALIELMDFEASGLANDTARATGMTECRRWHLPGGGSFGPWEWSVAAAAQSRREVRVADACALIRHRITDVLMLPPMETRARSKTTRRGDGHDPDTTTVYGDDLWTTRDGITRALLLAKLHRDAEQYTGRAQADLLEMPCPKCNRPTLIRLHASGQVECRACAHRMTDQDYDAHMYGLWKDHRLDEPTPIPEEPLVPYAPPPEGAVFVRPVNPTDLALILTNDNLEVARAWCGGEIRVDKQRTPPRRWLVVPGLLRIAESGDVIVCKPANGVRPAIWSVLDRDEYRSAYYESVHTP